MGENTAIISLWYGLAFLVNQKWKIKIYKLGKGGRIPILQLTRSRNKNKKRNRDMNRGRWVLNQAKKIRLENSRNILGGYKLNYDHVVDMHNTQI